MPIPEPGIYRPSNLTAEQQQEQLSAVYGVSMSELSHEEITRMRQIVQEHDARRQPMQTIDLNNPPKEFYRHQKFPMMVYDLQRSKPEKISFRIVASEKELEMSLADGFSLEAPNFGELPEQTLTVEAQREVAQAEEKIATAKRRKSFEAIS